MPSFAEAKDKYETLQTRLFNIGQEAGPDIDFSVVRSLTGTPQEKHRSWMALNDELNAAAVEYEQMKAVKAQTESVARAYSDARTPVNVPPLAGMGDYSPRPRSIGKLLEESKAFEAYRREPSGSIKIGDISGAEMKATLVVSSATPQAQREAFQDMGVEERTVIDMVGVSQTTANSLDYYEETTAPSQAAVVAENTAKPEATAGYTLRTVPVVKVAVWIPITKEALDDVPFLESQIKGRLAYNVNRVEEAQVLTGTGAAGPPQLIRGLNNATGIQTQAKGTDPTPDAIFKAMQLVRGAAGSGFAEPDGVVLNPNDWTDIKLLRAADGTYLWGSPAAEAGDRIWGLPVRQTTAQTANQGLVGAFGQGAEVYRREGITISMTDSHASNFISNVLVILAESRLALAIWRPTAFCTVTGI